ncbi:hypothetical protein [Myroides odoratus]|uniref:hypothetical protein n=1 Tax=Myroides odoratus TaxID=256 RepID=UPI00333EA382
MNKLEFLNKISHLKNENNIDMSVLANLLANLSYLYSDDIDFSVENSKTSIYISLKKYEHELDIDLINDFLDLRFSYVELNFFIREIENDVLEKILKNLLIGNYTLYYSIFDTGKVSNVELVWKDSTLSNFNSKDIYEMAITGNKVKVIEGFNWGK